MQGFVAGAGETGISAGDLGVGITHAEVHEVVVAWQPGGHGVGDFVGLGSKALGLDETTEGFGVSEVGEASGRIGADTSAQLAFVITTREVGHLTGSREEDFMAFGSCPKSAQILM